MSGKYPARVGVTQYIGGKDDGKLKDVPYLHYLPLEEKSIASALKEQGYQTWHIGKWHLGDEDFFPENHGFDVNIGGCHWGAPQQGYFSPWGLDNLCDGKDGDYLTDRLTDEAVKLIKNRQGKPFFLNMSHYAVHTPIQPPPELIKKYEDKARRLKLDQIDPFIEGEYFPVLHKSDQKVMRRTLQSDVKYAAMIENLDTNTGRLLAALQEENLMDDTLIVFVSDNGGLSTAEGSPTCNYPLSEGKGWNYEGGTRVCQFMHWPGVSSPGSLCDIPVTSTDLYPTFLQAAGADLIPDQHVDGVSLKPVLQGQNLNRQAIFWHYPHYGNQGGAPAASLISGDWKLIEFFEDSHLELYNLRQDISESRDLSEQEPAKTTELYSLLQSWQKDVEALIPEPNPDYEKLLKRPLVPNNAQV